MNEQERIRATLAEHVHLAVDVADLDDNDDLFQAGLTSHASVSLMLALEEEFDLEFPDELLRRDSFESIAAIARSIRTITGRAGRVIARVAEPLLADGIRARRRGGGRDAVSVDRDGRFPRRGRRRAALVRGARPRSCRPPLGGPELPLPDVAAACFELARYCPATGMVFAMHQIQVGCLVDHAAQRRRSSALPRGDGDERAC